MEVLCRALLTTQRVATKGVTASHGASTLRLRYRLFSEPTVVWRQPIISWPEVSEDKNRDWPLRVGWTRGINRLSSAGHTEPQTRRSTALPTFADGAIDAPCDSATAAADWPLHRLSSNGEFLNSAARSKYADLCSRHHHGAHAQRSHVAHIYAYADTSRLWCASTA